MHNNAGREHSIDYNSRFAKIKSNLSILRLYVYANEITIYQCVIRWSML